MTTLYPTALDTTTQLKNDAIDSTITAGLHAPQHNNVADAILAIEAELGTNPSGSYATVAAAIAASASLSPAADQIFQGTADVVPLVAKLSSGLDISNLFEARNASNTILAYITRLGGLSAASLSIAGTPLASTHLSDTAALARLASPTFTGTPAAPTAAPGTNTTQLATTAFVTAAAFAPIASPALTGTPTAPTAAVDTNTTQLATTAFVIGQGYAKLASPALTGTPTAPSAAPGTNTTQIATTAFVTTAVGNATIAPTIATSATEVGIGGSDGAWLDFSSTAIACLVTVGVTATYEVVWGCNTRNFSSNAHHSGYLGLSLNNATPAWTIFNSTAGGVAHSRTQTMALTSGDTLRLKKYWNDSAYGSYNNCTDRFIYIRPVA